MQNHLPARRQSAGPMRISVSAQEEHLKKEQANRPYARAAAKPGEDVLADERLNLKQQKGPRKNRQGIGRHRFDFGSASGQNPVPIGALSARGRFMGRGPASTNNPRDFIFLLWRKQPHRKCCREASRSSRSSPGPTWNLGTWSF